jgi:hypothetical protein
VCAAKFLSCHFFSIILPNANSGDSTQFNSPAPKLRSRQAGVSNLNQLKCHNQRHITTDGRSISKSWCQAPSGAHDHIFITLWQLRYCFCGAPSLTRGRICLLYMLLALASVVFLGTESLGTCYHILLSQIWDFPFRRLLRLAGSRWRHSTRFHTGSTQMIFSFYNPSARTTQKTQSIVEKACLQRCCISSEVIRLLLAYSLPQECVYRAVT